MPNESAADDAIALLEREGALPVCSAIESWAREGRLRDLVVLAAALEAKAPSGADRARFEQARDHLEDTVALTPGNAAIDAAIELLFSTRTRSVVVPRDEATRTRALASRLAFAQAPEALLEALDRTGEAPSRQELFACWFQEVVLRGASLVGEPRAVRFREKLAQARHPLAPLPLELQKPEREVPSYMPLYGDRGLSRALDALASGSFSVRSIPPPADGAAIKTRRIEDEEVLERMTRAVQPWAGGKAGKLEARIFAVEPSLRAGVLGSWLLRALPLESTSGANGLDCSQTPPEGVFGPLFSAASNGGAYSSGLGGAYGRLAAWTSLGALAGAPGHASIEAIVDAANACTFLTFRSTGPWFHDIAWDVGLLALRPQGNTLAVLAATDNE